MSAAAPESRPTADWKALHAFGLPGGSIRAFMALLIFGSLWGHLLLRPDHPIPESLKDLLFIILGHYFAVRNRQEPGDVPGPPPLYLPRGAVRLMLIAGFVGVALALHRRGHLISVKQNPGVVTLLLVFGFLLGVVIQAVASWWSGGGRRLPRIVEDLRAGVSLLAAIALAILVWDQSLDFLPGGARAMFNPEHLGLGPYGPEHVMAAIVGFYFGSRS